MTDIEIKKYLEENNYTIPSRDCIRYILSASHQIIDERYNFDTHMMTIKTPENTFKIKLTLDQIWEEI